MNGLISLENMSLRPVSKEILELNEVSSKYGLVLTEEEAGELSDTRNKSIVENGRGSVDTLIGREVERIIRKVNSGENYAKWFADRDELNLKPGVGQRETPDNYVREEYGDDYFDGVESDGPADHDLYEDDFDEEDTEIDELDAFDEFLDSEAVMQKEDNPNPDAAKEDMDDDDEEKDYD